MGIGRRSPKIYENENEEENSQDSIKDTMEYLEENKKVFNSLSPDK